MLKKILTLCLLVCSPNLLGNFQTIVTALNIVCWRMLHTNSHVDIVELHLGLACEASSVMDLIAGDSNYNFFSEVLVG